MPAFEIKSHNISSRQWDNGGEVLESHTLELEGTRDRAILMFDSGLDIERLGSVVGFANDEGDGSVALVGWFPLHEFETWKELLQNRERVTVDFELRDSGAVSGYLRRLVLRTGSCVIAANHPHSPEDDCMRRTSFAVPL